MDKRIKVALEPFVILPMQVVDLENRFDGQAKEMTGVDLATFKDALDKVKAEVRVLQQHQIMMPTDPAVE